MHYVLALILLCAISLPSVSFATVTITVQPPSHPKWSIRIAVLGQGAVGPDTEPAIRVTLPPGTSTLVLDDAKVRAAFPKTDWIGVTAQYLTESGKASPWFTYPDGTYSYKAFPVALIPPPLPPDPLPPDPVPPDPAPLDARIQQLEAAMESGLADLAAAEAQLAQIKSAVCQTRASAGSLAAKLQAALGGCQ